MTELLEREDLLARLELARSEGGRLVFVGGEAGVGKTALVRAFASRAESRVLVGSCENLTTPTPLGPFLDLGLEPGEPRLVAGALLEELRGPALLVLEDVHWADQATLDALRVLGRRVESTPSLLLATYRDDEVEADHPLRVVLGELASAPSVSRLTVPRLSPEAVRELAAPQDADADAIYRLTRGNAFYVTEILAAGTETLPETVRDAVLARGRGWRSTRGSSSTRPRSSPPGPSSGCSRRSCRASRGCRRASPPGCCRPTATRWPSGTSWRASPSRARSPRR